MQFQQDQFSATVPAKFTHWRVMPKLVIEKRKILVLPPNTEVIKKEV